MRCLELTLEISVLSCKKFLKPYARNAQIIKHKVDKFDFTNVNFSSKTLLRM